MSILARTRHFCDLYQHAAGQFHTPPQFHKWSALALIAAAMGDRVYLRRFRHAPLFPNLYIFLVGPAGIGKDHATGFAKSLIPVGAAPYINVFPGNLTQAHLSDILTRNQSPKRKPPGDSGAAMWLVQSELLADLPGGDLTTKLIADLVKLYSGSGAVMLNATRMHGERLVEMPPVINWLAGSTPEWFTKAITPDIFDSGFAGRSIFVRADRDYGVRFPEPIYPDDYEDVIAHLRRRVALLTMTRGEFSLAPRASAIERAWVADRPPPADDVEAKIWDRQHVMSLKLAMVLALAERSAPLIIGPQHMAAAQTLVTTLSANAIRLAENVHVTPDTAQFHRIHGTLQRAGRMPHRRLLQMVSKFGCTSQKVREVTRQLVEQGDLVMIQEKAGMVYEWIGRSARLRLVE